MPKSHKQKKIHYHANGKLNSKKTKDKPNTVNGIITKTNGFFANICTRMPFLFLFLSLILIVLIYYFICSLLKQQIFSASGWDSYLIQAKTWLTGHIELGKDYPYLELAQFKDAGGIIHYHTSFPIVPTFPILALMPFFNGNVPSNLVVKLYAILSFVVTYFICKKRFKLSDISSAFWAMFFVFGSNLLFISIDGGVWFQSQSLNFLFTCVSIYFIMSNKERDLFIGMMFWALAIGCRTTQIIFFPVYAYFLYTFHTQRGEKPLTAVLKSLKYLIIPAFIGIGYAVYNFVRFHSFTEFGYKYRPEFMRVGQIMFSWDYFHANWRNIFRLPTITLVNTTFTLFNHYFTIPLIDFRKKFIDVPAFDGFAFYIANPIFITFFVRMAISIIKSCASFLDQIIKPHQGDAAAEVNTNIPINIHSILQKMPVRSILIFLCMVAYTFTLLFFKGLGSWQFGLRYFVDMLPFALIYILYNNPKIFKIDIPIMIFAIAFNIYGTLYILLSWNK